ncbi:MAG: SpoIIE family protein phosphatase [bacterium]|nr:SpoIIE family protein phosphatase [bacterium]
MQTIDHQFVLKSIEFIKTADIYAIVLEDFKGVSLKELLKEKKFDINIFLGIAIKVATALGHLHKHNIVHLDIKPANILSTRDFNSVKISDFGISQILTHENENLYNPYVIEGTMVYISPEQTGRMNREVDYRSDLYSLGISFYEMLTGIVPFTSDDPMELIHSHIARVPVLPDKLNLSVPKVISKIVMKLLSKKAEERYRNRFNFAFRNFTAALAKKEHPLILFLDDMQWVDSASMNLLTMLFSDMEIDNLYAICAYRDNEVDETHVFTRSLEEIKKTGQTIKTISLSPLTAVSVNRFISEITHGEEKLTLPLAEIVCKKTEGNPFFVNQFLKTLHSEGILNVDPEHGWKWDIQRVREMQVTDNVVDLLAHTITHLPVKTREILRMCACIGNRFDLETLSNIKDISIEEALDEITPALENEILRLSGDMYHFRHDRTQEAAYSIIDTNEKKLLHYRIGNWFLKQTPEKHLREKIIYIVDQLNAGRSLAKTAEEKDHLARLNLQAGMQAFSSAAYESALNYETTGIDLLGTGCWEKKHELSFALHRSAAEAAYLSGRYDTFQKISEGILENTVSPLEKVKIYELKVLTCTAENKPFEAVQIGVKSVNMLGIRLPEKPRLYHLLFGLLKAKIVIIGKTKEEFLNLPEMKDPVLLAVMHILAVLALPAYWAAPAFLPIMAFKFIILTAKQGNSSRAPFGYASYGSILCSLGQIEESYDFGELVLELVQDPVYYGQYAMSHYTVNTLIRHWKVHLRETIEPLLFAYHAGLETGDFEWSSISLVQASLYSYNAGYGLKKLETECLENTKKIIKLNQKNIEIRIQILHQTILILRGKDSYSSQLNGSVFNEGETLSALIETGDRSNISYIDINKLVLSFLFHEYRHGLPLLKKEKEILEALMCLYETIIFYFYGSLTCLALYSYDPEYRGKKYLLRQVKKYLKKIKKWARHAPMNHLHKYFLVKAELARVQKQKTRAIEYYERAIEGARENKFHHEEALANELAARFWFEQGSNTYGAIHIREAVRCYFEWGCYARVKQLEKLYPHLISGLLIHPAAESKEDTGTLSSTGTAGSSTTLGLDLASIIKTSQALSSEVDLEKLLKRIMKVAIENAGAEKGYFILTNEEDGRLYIEASGGITEQVSVLQSIPVDGNSSLPLTIINYVDKTDEAVVLHNAERDERFLKDPYILKNKSHSILCMPFRYKGSIDGILYLENNLAAGVFTPERIELLQIFSSQAAISIENSRLLAHREKAARLNTEMQIAANIQTSLLPRNPVLPGFEVTAYMKPANRVGGDYYDFISTPENDWVIIGDVSGHGVPAGLVMMMVQTLIQGVLRNMHDISPSKLLCFVNEAVRYNIKLMKQDKYMTIHALLFEKNENKAGITYSGQHLDLLIYRSAAGTVERIETRGAWIGLWDNLDEFLEDKSFSLFSGDVLFLHTDGITESWKKGSIKHQRDPQLEMFGEARLINILSQNGRRSTNEIQAAVLKELDEFDPIDDITMVILKKE